MSLRRCSTPTYNEDKVERIPRNHSDDVSDLLGLLGADLGGDVLERLGRRRPVVVDLLHRSAGIGRGLRRLNRLNKIFLNK